MAICCGILALSNINFGPTPAFQASPPLMEGRKLLKSAVVFLYINFFFIYSYFICPHKLKFLTPPSPFWGEGARRAGEGLFLVLKTRLALFPEAIGDRHLQITVAIRILEYSRT